MASMHYIFSGSYVYTYVNRDLCWSIFFILYDVDTYVVGLGMSGLPFDPLGVLCLLVADGGSVTPMCHNSMYCVWRSMIKNTHDTPPSVCECWIPVTGSLKPIYICNIHTYIRTLTYVFTLGQKISTYVMV